MIMQSFRVVHVIFGTSAFGFISYMHALCAEIKSSHPTLNELEIIVLCIGFNRV